MVSIALGVGVLIGIAIGVWIGYMRWGRPDLMSLEERLQLQDRQLQLEGELRKVTDNAKAAELIVITRRLDADRRKRDARAKRKDRVERRKLVQQNLDA